MDFEYPHILILVVFLHHEHPLISDHLLDNAPDNLPIIFLLLLSGNGILVELHTDYVIYYVPLG